MRALALLALLMLPAPGAAQCLLCAAGGNGTSEAARRPLSIEVRAALDFSRATSRGGGGGSIAIDEHSGARRVEGLVDLGGYAITGSALLTGEPYAHVRVSMPVAVRLTAPDGSAADAVDLRADLPPDARLGADGSLSFSFGGRLMVAGGASGDFRGRIAITADYE